MDEVINYVMETPGNTNPNVLRGMLQNSSGGGNAAFYVTFSGSTSESTAACDKTFAEVKEAYDAGKVIITRYVDPESSPEQPFMISDKTWYHYEGSELAGITMESVTYESHTEMRYKVVCYLSEDMIDVYIEW